MNWQAIGEFLAAQGILIWDFWSQVVFPWSLETISDWLPMSPLEIFATVFGLWSVWCYVKESVWSWPTGLINVLCYIVLFPTQHLYAETGLNVIFAGLQLYGWWEWLYGGKEHTGVKVEITTAKTWVVLTVLAVAAIVPLGLVIQNYSPSNTPWWDTIPTILSLVAQYMITKKLLENWIVWIAVDCISIPLFAYKGFYLTAGLYVVFLGLCIKGYFEWKRTLTAASVPASAAA